MHKRKQRKAEKDQGKTVLLDHDRPVDTRMNRSDTQFQYQSETDTRVGPVGLSVKNFTLVGPVCRTGRADRSGRAV